MRDGERGESVKDGDFYAYEARGRRSYGARRFRARRDRAGVALKRRAFTSFARNERGREKRKATSPTRAIARVKLSRARVSRETQRRRAMPHLRDAISRSFRAAFARPPAA